MTLLPLLIILVIVGAAYFLVAKLKSGNMKRIHWMINIYVAILIVGTIVYFFLPNPANIVDNHVAKYEPINLVDRVHKGESLDDVDQYIKKQWEFEYEQSELELVEAYDDETYLNVSVSIERKDVDDGKIEATYYQTPIVVEGIDITEYLKPIDMELSNEALHLIPAIEIELLFTMHKSEFPMRQFSGESWWLDDDDNIRFNEQVLHLRIPKSVEIINEDDYFDIQE